MSNEHITLESNEVADSYVRWASIVHTNAALIKPWILISVRETARNLLQPHPLQAMQVAEIAGNMAHDTLSRGLGDETALVLLGMVQRATEYGFLNFKSGFPVGQDKSEIIIQAFKALGIAATIADTEAKGKTLEHTAVVEWEKLSKAMLAAKRPEIVLSAARFEQSLRGHPIMRRSEALGAVTERQIQQLGSPAIT